MILVLLQKRALDQEMSNIEQCLDTSLQNLSLDQEFSFLDTNPTFPIRDAESDDEETQLSNDIPKQFGLNKFDPPPLLC